MNHRLVLLVSTPRVAPGLLSRDAWAALGSAHLVLGVADDPQVAALVEAGVGVTTVGDHDSPTLARRLVAGTADGDVVWVSSADGDPGLNEAVAVEVTRLPDPPEVEVLVGSYDVPGSRLLDVVAVMDRLRSPGGCPWDAEQTPQSLLPFLLEEAYEAIEAVESGDRAQMEEELGDLLLQVAFQARIAQEHATEPFDIDDVAGTLVDKLVRRHPHVFAGHDADTPAAARANWAVIKAGEKPDRVHPLEGVPASLPALALADTYLGRLDKAGWPAVADEVVIDVDGATSQDQGQRAGDVGSRLLALVREARDSGVDAEAALRHTLRRLRERASEGRDPT